MENIGVSILCLAYNHEKYIGETIESFLMQKTDFPIEIIINEDASSDHTAEIIRRYEIENPDLIKVIYHQENTYSKGININCEYMLPLAKGKYVALCDGDDVWTSPYKLQKQYEALETHLECFACFHKVYESIEDNNQQADKYIPSSDLKSGVYSSKVFLSIFGNGSFFNEVCYFFRRDLYAQYQKNFPHFAQLFMKNKSDDVPMLLYFSQLGSVYYINESLALYRHFTAGSWSEANRKVSREEFKMFCENSVVAYESFNEYTNHIYEKEISHRINYFKFKSAECEDNYEVLLSSELQEVWNTQRRTYKFRIKLLNKNKLFQYIFSVYDTFRNVKKKL